MKTRIKSILIFFASVFLLAGCNIYEFTSPSDNTRNQIEEGKQMLRDGDYAGAYNKFDEALRDDPNNSEIRYLHAKAAMRQSGANAVSLATTLSTFETNSSGPSNLPFMDPDEWPYYRADSLFQGVIIANDDLWRIKSGEATGFIDANDILLDLTIVLSINGILMFRDTNGNQMIDENDINLGMFFRNGRLNMEELAQLDSAAINSMINNAVDLLEIGGEAVKDFILQLSGDEDSGIDNEALENVIDNIQDGALEYKIEIGVDNDGDGLIDEEWLNNIDDDGDGRIDEDSNGQPGP